MRAREHGCDLWHLTVVRWNASIPRLRPDVKGRCRRGGHCVPLGITRSGQQELPVKHARRAYYLMPSGTDGASVMRLRGCGLPCGPLAPGAPPWRGGRWPGLAAGKDPRKPATKAPSYSRERDLPRASASPPRAAALESPCSHAKASSSALTSCRSIVSKPSVNHP
jgi:hypothetical protein